MFIVKKIASILLGSLFLSVGINFFLVPFHLLDGGIIGLGLIINYLTGAQAGLIIIALSFPIFLIAYFYNKDYFFNSLHGMLFSSFAIDYISPLHYPYIERFSLHPVTSSVVGGIIIGIGIGIMLRYKTSTGGTDLLAQLLSKSLNINVGVIILAIDALVITLGGLLISTETLMLSALAVTFIAISTSLCTWNVEH